MANKPATKKCDACFGGHVISSADSEAQAAIDAADNLGTMSFAEIIKVVGRRYPRSVVTCPTCDGTRRVPA